MSAAPAAASSRIAYIVSGNPFASGSHGTSGNKRDGMVPASSVLRLHIWALATLPTRLAMVMVRVRTCRECGATVMDCER